MRIVNRIPQNFITAGIGPIPYYGDREPGAKLYDMNEDYSLTSGTKVLYWWMERRLRYADY